MLWECYRKFIVNLKVIKNNFKRLKIHLLQILWQKINLNKKPGVASYEKKKIQETKKLIYKIVKKNNNHEITCQQRNKYNTKKRYVVRGVVNNKNRKKK